MLEYRKLWTLDYLVEPAHIDTAFTPPNSIDDLIKPPSTMIASFPIGYPTQDEALAELKSRVVFSAKNVGYSRAAYESQGELTPELKRFFDGYQAYIEAVQSILAELETPAIA